ncbi:MAG: DNA-processing protein DprA [Anaerolineales bacterium]|nr:MAG: DNA-processing protein DprA [Anaerolineales bacterium]
MKAPNLEIARIKPLGTDLDSIGNINLLDLPLFAIFSSAKCPGSSILKAHEYAKEIRNGEMGVISGFHAPAEKEVLEVLLKGTCPIVVVLGRSLKNARIPSVWKEEIGRDRMLVISPFKEYQKYVTREISLKRNELAARIAGRVLIVHASQGGSLQGQIAMWKLDEIEITHLSL